MEDAGHDLMAELEPVHWWYRGMRDLIARVLRARRLVERSGLQVLDAGCGTGENLRMLAETLSTSYLGGFDISPLAIDFCRRKVPQADVYLGDLCSPELHAGGYDLILSCDVLSDTGLDVARDGMGRLADHLHSGGLLILNLPAYPWLFSAHDLAVGTRERFTAAKVRALLDELGLETELLTYRLFVLFPVVVLARLPSMLRRHHADSAAGSNLVRTNALANYCLTQILKCENAAIMQGIRWPWGSSILAVARRR
jgi:SAM-dependent methyltransferase